MASPFLNPWTWLVEEVVTIVAGHLITGGVALVSGPDPFREDQDKNKRLVRYYRRNWKEIKNRLDYWEQAGLTVPPAVGIFGLQFINFQRGTYEAYKVPPSVDPLFAQVDHWCNEHFVNDLADYDQAYSFFWLPLNFFSPFELFRQLLYPPFNELGCVVEHTRRFLCMSMLIDALQVDGFSGVAKRGRGVEI